MVKWTKIIGAVPDWVFISIAVCVVMIVFGAFAQIIKTGFVSFAIGAVVGLVVIVVGFICVWCNVWKDGFM